MASGQPWCGTETYRGSTRTAYVQHDGFILGSHVSPTGLDEFVAKVVPLLRERGVLRSEYTGTTLREHLGLRLGDGLGEPRGTPTAP